MGYISILSAMMGSTVAWLKREKLMELEDAFWRTGQYMKDSGKITKATDI